MCLGEGVGSGSPGGPMYFHFQWRGGGQAKIGN